MRAIHYTCFLGNTRSIYQYLIFPEFKVEWSMDYNTDHSGIKDRRDLFEARYNDFLENIDLAEISLRFPVESLKRPGIYSDSVVNVYKAAGPLRCNNDYSRILMFKIHSHKALGNNLGRLSRNSYAEWISSDFPRDNFLKGIISTNEVEFLKETPETFLEILINPETTPNFGIYLEMKLLKQFNLI
jgi:hypothetical protein